MSPDIILISPESSHRQSHLPAVTTKSQLNAFYILQDFSSDSKDEPEPLKMSR